MQTVKIQEATVGATAIAEDPSPKMMVAVNDPSLPYNIPHWHSNLDIHSR